MRKNTPKMSKEARKDANRRNKGALIENAHFSCRKCDSGKYCSKHAGVSRWHGSQLALSADDPNFLDKAVEMQQNGH